MVILVFKPFQIYDHVRPAAMRFQKSMQSLSGEWKQHIVNKGNRRGGAFDVEKNCAHRSRLHVSETRCCLASGTGRNTEAGIAGQSCCQCSVGSSRSRPERVEWP